MADETIAVKATSPRGLKAWLAENKSIMEMLGILGGLMGLVVLMIQTYQVGQQTEALTEQISQSANQDIFSRTLDAGKMAFDNPVLFQQITAAEGTRPALILNEIIKEKPDSKETLAAYQLAAYYIDFYDYILSEFPESNYPQLGKPDEPDEGYVAWSNAIKEFYKPGSLVCRELIASKNSYGGSYVRRLKAAGLCPGL